MTCVVTATLNGKAVSVNTKLHAAQMGTNNKPCEFTTVGNQNVLADCVEGENVVNNGTSINGTTVNENFVYRFNLTGAKQTLGSINFSAGQVFPFAVNNWSGQITTTAAAAGYNLKSSSGTITGSLRP